MGLPEFFLLKYLFQKHMMLGSYRVRREGFRRLAPDPVLSSTGKTSTRNDSGPDTFRCQVRSSGFRRLRAILTGGGPQCNHKLQGQVRTRYGMPHSLWLPRYSGLFGATRVGRYRDNPATFCAVEVTCLSEIPTEIGVSCLGPLPPVPSCPSSLRPQAQSFPVLSMA